jgi:hypothetical protein
VSPEYYLHNRKSEERFSSKKAHFLTDRTELIQSAHDQQGSEEYNCCFRLMEFAHLHVRSSEKLLTSATWFHIVEGSEAL